MQESDAHASITGVSFSFHLLRRQKPRTLARAFLPLELFVSWPTLVRKCLFSGFSFTSVVFVASQVPTELSSYSTLLTALGVRKKFAAADFVAVLRSIHTHFRGRALDQRNLDLAVGEYTSQFHFLYCNVVNLLQLLVPFLSVM